MASSLRLSRITCSISSFSSMVKISATIAITSTMMGQLRDETGERFLFSHLNRGWFAILADMDQLLPIHLDRPFHQLGDVERAKRQIIIIG